VSVAETNRRHLLTHAAAMGGCLLAGYVHSYDGVAGQLIEEGLTEWVSKDGRACWQLTEAGRSAAAVELGGAR
jgi:hypothetical protein